ncbi:hypothetical protein [Neptunomonas phycophila]|uniref:hypothetical protein n=1 Tax=Neptunomonas phycophila TaxID=1572645 RepID=UPI003BAD8469
MSYRWKVNFGADSVLSAQATNVSYDLISNEMSLVLEQPEVLGVDFLSELTAILKGSGVIVIDQLMGTGKPHTHLVFVSCKPIEHKTELDYGDKGVIKHEIKFEFAGMEPRTPKDLVKKIPKKKKDQ